jgi:hypothetical protein
MCCTVLWLVNHVYVCNWRACWTLGKADRRSGLAIQWNTRRSSWHAALFFPDKPTLPYYEEYIYEVVEIFYDYHYQMVLRVNNFLCKPEGVRIYCLPKQAF